jgi:DNA polymerase elongation subunit (family B)
MEIEFAPVDFQYFDFNGRNYIILIGKDKKGKRICVVDSIKPFFWAILKPNISEKRIEALQKEIQKIKIESNSRTTSVEKTEVHGKKFLGKEIKAIKIFITNYKDAHDVADKLDFEEIEARRGYDLNIITSYIIEKKIIPLSWHKVSGEILDNNELGSASQGIDADLCIKAKTIEKIEDQNFSPKILAFDIEVDELEIGKGEILMISLVSNNFKKVLTWKKCPEKLDYLECFKDEAEMLEKFVEYVKNQNPDLLVGYFSDGFDLPYLRARCEKNKMKLSLGIDNSQPTFTRGRILSGKIFGIIHLDLFRFIEKVYSQYLKSETLGLNEVASELLGETKQAFNHRHSSKIKQEEWKEYFEYNLQDSLLTYKLAEKLWPDMLEFSRIIREPIFDITRDGMSQHVENYILHNLERFDEIPEKRPIHNELEERMQREKYEGAFVFRPKPGLYEDLCIFDFTSMHASIIVSYNISKGTLLKEEGKDCYESPELELENKKNKFYFSKKPGFFPSLLKEIVELRKKYKEEFKEKPNPITKARSNAYKLLANAYYGYMGFFGARYYSIESAASTLAFVRKFNKWTIEKVGEQGYNVVFGDTDSVGFTLNNKTKKQTLDFLEKLNSELPGIMELDLEDFYKRGIWVTKRTGEFGAKKKYALINEQGKIKIRGFETVRRDWCKLARDLQNKVIEKILKEGNEKSALEIVKETIKNLKQRKIKISDILIRTQLKKIISEYKAITPHVIAAQKMQEKGTPLKIGMLIEYFIAETREKKSLVREKVKLPEEKGEYNIDYYLNNQIIPAVENIFEIFNINVKEITSGKKQMKLGEF